MASETSPFLAWQQAVQKDAGGGTPDIAPQAIQFSTPRRDVVVDWSFPAMDRPSVLVSTSVGVIETCLAALVQGPVTHPWVTRLCVGRVSDLNRV